MLLVGTTTYDDSRLMRYFRNFLENEVELLLSLGSAQTDRVVNGSIFGVSVTIGTLRGDRNLVYEPVGTKQDTD